MLRVVRMIVLLCFPMLAGCVFLKKEEENTFSSMIRIWIIGQFCLWAVFQLISVPLILMKSSFSLLFWLYFAIMLALAAGGVMRARGARFHFSLCLPRAPVMWIVLIAVIVLIIWQTGTYIFGVHLDEDDSRWLAQTNDALLSGQMFLHNPATGVYAGDFIPDLLRDLPSPWPMYLAFMCRFTGISAAIMYHTVYAPILLLMSYGIYVLIARELFKGTDERIIFMLGIAVINLFFAGNGSTQSIFTLVRIWQGKAVVAAILIPAILLQILMIQRTDTIPAWIELAVTGCAGCLPSGMGILIGLITIGGYGFYTICCKRFKRIPLWLAALLFPIIFQLISLKIGGTSL